jgi:NAD(P)H-dependent FMN reductase
MIHIISGTNRPGARSLMVSNLLKNWISDSKVDCKVIDLSQFDFSQLDGSHYAEPQPEHLAKLKKELNSSRGFYFVVPEYNGSMPGILKYFIDHWSYPETFEYRPVAFVGLGGRFGGLRPVEHLQQVMGYRNAYQFPERVFIQGIFTALENGQLKDSSVADLLKKQSHNFIRFVKALESSKLDANSHLLSKS